MRLVMGLWILAMVSGLAWGARATRLCAGAAIVVWLAGHAAMLASWTGWLQLVTLGVAPVLLSLQRARDEACLTRARAEEAKRLAELSTSARSLLSLRASTEQFERQITDLTHLYRVTKETTGTLRLSELFEELTGIVPRLLDIRGLRLIDGADAAAQVFRWTVGETRTRPQGASQLLDAERAALERAAVSSQPGLLSSTEGSLRFPEGLTQMGWAPLWRKQRLAGVLMADEVSAAHVKTLAIIAHQVSLQLSRIHLYHRAEALAVTDALTGVFVRAHFLKRASAEVVRSQHQGLSCTLLMSDLDLFKQKNDTYGHLVGDVVLKEVARLLKRNLRDVDLIARFGGEEFILLMVETDADHAMLIAQRLRQLVEVHPIRAYDELLSQTVSMGLAAFPDDAQTVEVLIERADQALYAAKRAGRNRVVRWTPALGGNT